MSSIYILVIEDEPEVLDALVNDLAALETTFPVEACDNTEDAESLIQEINQSGDSVGLILCDHILPGEHGVQFLVRMRERHQLEHTRMVLVTGQAGFDDTILALNQAGLNHFIAKPWDSKQLLKVAKEQLTNFVIQTQRSLMPFLGILDAEKIGEAMRERIPGDS